MKRVLSLLLVLGILLGMTACGGSAEEKGTEIPTSIVEETEAPAVIEYSEEIVKAKELGFATDEVLEKLGDTISFDTYVLMLDHMVEQLTPDNMEQWKTRSASFRNSSETMKRCDGAIALLYAAECVGTDTMGFEYIANLPDKVARKVDFFKGIFQGNTSVFPERLELYQPEALMGTGWEFRCYENYMKNAGWFVQQRSYVSGKTYFDYNEDYTMDFDKAFTYEAALKSVVRLHETSMFQNYISVEEAKCTISQEALAAGAALPEATEKKLPDWHGFTIPLPEWGSANYAGKCYQEEEVAVICEMGFNFVRVPLNARDFFHDEDYTHVNKEQLYNLDRLIGWCAQYGIHVCIDLHRMAGYDPGIETDLYQSEARRAQFVAIWQFFARYYKDVSPNLLSFNLINEPSAGYPQLTEREYTSLLLPAIEVIRAENPGRIIVADVVIYGGEPCRALASTGVVQSWHPYLIFDDVGFQTWPFIAISGLVHKSKEDFTLNGSFPAGTKITIHISRFHKEGSLELLSDGETVGAIELREEELWGEGYVWECTLPTDSSNLVVKHKGNSQYYELTTVLLDTGNRLYELKKCNLVIENRTEAPNIELSEDGSISDGGKGTAVIMSSEVIMKAFEAMTAFREETGVQIMAQEFGFSYKVPNGAAKAAFNDLLLAFETLDIPWCSWCQDLGPLLDSRNIELRQSWGLDDLCRPGSTYTQVSDNWIVDEELMKVYQKYMGS